MKQIIFIVVATLLVTVSVGASRPAQTEGVPKFESVKIPKPIKADLASVSHEIAESANIPQKAPVAPPVSSGGTKEQWMSAAGIPQSDWQYVDYIVNKESSWNPSATNPNGGACGLVQALPCSKLGPNWSDPVHALKWQLEYVTARYGGYAGAYSFWLANHWY